MERQLVDDLVGRRTRGPLPATLRPPRAGRRHGGQRAAAVRMYVATWASAPDLARSRDAPVRRPPPPAPPDRARAGRAPARQVARAPDSVAPPARGRGSVSAAAIVASRSPLRSGRRRAPRRSTESLRSGRSARTTRVLRGCVRCHPRACPTSQSMLARLFRPVASWEHGAGRCRERDALLDVVDRLLRPRRGLAPSRSC